ncbi:MAG: Helix-turn-helix domain [Bacteroidota bacterium]|jgi:transcriptional regulator with XRE-family HTH domain
MIKNKTIEAVKKQIGENLREIRLRSKIEVKKICNDLEISPAAYSNIERGVSDLNISKIIILSEYFGVHFSSILSIDNVTNYNFVPHNTSTGTQHNSQITHQQLDGYLSTIEVLKSEVEFLKSQNNELMTSLCGSINKK